MHLAEEIRLNSSLIFYLVHSKFNEPLSLMLAVLLACRLGVLRLQKAKERLSLSSFTGNTP